MAGSCPTPRICVWAASAGKLVGQDGDAIDRVFIMFDLLAQLDENSGEEKNGGEESSFLDTVFDSCKLPAGSSGESEAALVTSLNMIRQILRLLVFDGKLPVKIELDQRIFEYYSYLNITPI